MSEEAGMRDEKGRFVKGHQLIGLGFTKGNIPWNKGKILDNRIKKDVFEDLNYNQRMTQEDIAKKFNTHRTSIVRYFKKFGIKVKYNRRSEHDGFITPNLNPSEELSYLLGVLYGDGTCYKDKGHYAIRLEANDKEFVVEFARCLASVTGREKYSIYCNKRKQFIVVGSSKKLYRFLEERLSLSHKEVIEKYPASFIRGFFDSEGSVHHIQKRKNAYRISMCNTNYALLLYVKELLEKYFNIFCTQYERGSTEHKTLYTLHIKASSQCKFAEFIESTIQRKKDVLDNLLQQRRGKICLWCGLPIPEDSIRQKFCCDSHMKKFHNMNYRKKKRKLIEHVKNT